MAQALFKSWFVDFDPVIDNALAAGNPIPPALEARAEGRKTLEKRAEQRRTLQPSSPLPEHIRQLFPSGFVFDTEMGWIPEGWEAGSLRTLAEVITDGAHKSPASVDPRDGLPMASSKDLTSEGININSCRYISKGDFDDLVRGGCAPVVSVDPRDGLPMASSKDLTSEGININSCRYISKGDFDDLVRGGCAPVLGDVLISKDGSRCGETCCIYTKKHDVVLLSSIAIIRPKVAELSSYINTLLSRKTSIADLRENYVSGSAIPRIVLKDFKRFPALIPSENVLKEWDKHISLLNQKRTTNVTSSQSLSFLRDTLLPKLISGELRIPEAQQQAVAASA